MTELLISGTYRVHLEGTEGHSRFEDIEAIGMARHELEAAAVAAARSLSDGHSMIDWKAIGVDRLATAARTAVVIRAELRAYLAATVGIAGHNRRARMMAIVRTLRDELAATPDVPATNLGALTSYVESFTDCVHFADSAVMDYPRLALCGETVNAGSRAAVSCPACTERYAAISRAAELDKLAEDMAEAEAVSPTCPRCYGSGCPRCESSDVQCSGCEDIGGCPGDCGQDAEQDARHVLTESELLTVRDVVYRSATNGALLCVRLPYSDCQAVYDHAMETARDCEWAEGSFDVALHELTPADVVRNMARHYDGGMAQMVIDALGDTHASSIVAATDGHGAARTLPDYRNATTGELVMVPGAMLPNGSVVVAASAAVAHKWFVLAMRPGRVTDAYVTWTCARPGDGSDTTNGHYLDTITEATADYVARIARGY